MSVPKVLYRYERSYIHELAEPEIWLQEFEVVKETEKSYLIKDKCYRGNFRWVKKTDNNSKKRYAYATTDEAYEAFIARTKRCIKILEAHLHAAEVYVTAKKPDNENQLRLEDYDDIIS